jgi:GNAT superfamily N-acetyltransferase
MAVRITKAESDRLPVLSGVFGRSFVDEPMMRWPLGEHGDVAARFAEQFGYFLEGLFEPGFVWEAGEDGHALGGAIWVPPYDRDAWEAAYADDPRVNALTEDGGRRYDAFWAWVESKHPAEPLWCLDSIGVEPAAQGRGIGSALVEHGLARARADGIGVYLFTGTARNVPYYERFGFRVAEQARAPEAGPVIWFMRLDA